MLRFASRLVLALPLFAFGCNTPALNTDGGVGSGLDLSDDNPPDLLKPDLMLPGRDPTDHPQLVTMDFHGGPVMTNIEVWTVVWKGDEALGANVNRFIGWMVNSDDYWVPAVSEYGVGKGKAMGVLVIKDAMGNPMAAPAVLPDSGVEPLIKQQVAQGNFPAPTANTLFSFVIPPNTQSNMGRGGVGCQDYGGYHSEARKANSYKDTVSYAINLQCPGGGFGGNTAFDSLTEVISHEVAETATDPYPGTKPGWRNDYQPLGGEDGDLCVGLSNAYKVAGDPTNNIPDSTYFVTRLWSNKAATAGNVDPCQPTVGKRPYFNVAFDPADLEINSDPTQDQVIQAQFEPYAFGDVGLIKWQVETTYLQGITVEPDHGQGMAGDTIRVNITVSKNAQAGPYPMYLYVQSQRGGHNQWVSLVNIN